MYYYTFYVYALDENVQFGICLNSELNEYIYGIPTIEVMLSLLLVDFNLLSNIKFHNVELVSDLVRCANDLNWFLS